MILEYCGVQVESSSAQFVEDLRSISPDIEVIPAHAWTPWFGIFGSASGYDSLVETFDELSSHIFAIETGLSSDPIMNRRCYNSMDDAQNFRSDACNHECAAAKGVGVKSARGSVHRSSQVSVSFDSRQAHAAREPSNPDPLCRPNGGA